MTTEEIQQESLLILDEFHRFCIENGIRYSIAYGTLIGAVRHGGFIPWDDDIDVFMPRPDYDRFLETYKDSEDYQLIYCGKRHCTMTYARLCDMKKTEVKSKSPWMDGTTGVWIDIFPIDAAPDSLEETTVRYLKCHDMYRDILSRRRTLRYRNSKKLADKFKLALYLILGKTHAEKHTEEFCRFCNAIPYGSTNRVMDFASPIGRKVFTYQLSDMDEYIDMKFCDRTYKAVANYDRMLREQYGDYMQLPPVELQVPGHSMHDTTWKH